MTKMYRIEGKKPIEVLRSSRYLEDDIEEWIANDVDLLGLDIIIIGRQVLTDHGNRLDLLGIDGTGGLVILELKKNRTPREVVAQTLDYASWACNLTTARIHEIAKGYLKQELSGVFLDRFGEALPDRLNDSHSMHIIAGEFDDASRRIVEYLAEQHDVSINTFFFDIFESDGSCWLTTDTLFDQAEVEERRERRTQLPWSGYWYVNAGQDHRRSWADMVKYGFVSAGGGKVFSRPLEKLQPDQPIFVYQKGEGYVGYGIVKSTRVLAKDFRLPGGEVLFDQPLEPDGMKRDADDPDLAEYAVAIEWKKTFAIEDAKWFKGGFANQNVVCKLQDRNTLDFLRREFGVTDDTPDQPAELVKNSQG